MATTTPSLPERPCDKLGREVDHQPHEFDHPDGHATCPGWPMAPRPLTDRIAEALSTAGAFCGACGFEPGDIGCPDCVSVRGLYVAALLPLFDAENARLRQQVRYDAGQATETEKDHS